MIAGHLKSCGVIWPHWWIWIKATLASQGSSRWVPEWWWPWQGEHVAWESDDCRQEQVPSRKQEVALLSCRTPVSHSSPRQSPRHGGYWAPLWGTWEHLPSLGVPWGHPSLVAKLGSLSMGYSQPWKWPEQPPHWTILSMGMLQGKCNQGGGQWLQAGSWVQASSLITTLRSKVGACWLLIQLSQTNASFCFLASLPSNKVLLI